MDLARWIASLNVNLENAWQGFLLILKDLSICQQFREIGVGGTQKLLLLTSTGYIYIAIPLFIMAAILRWWTRLPRYDKKGDIIRYKQYAGHSLDQRLYQTGIILLFASMICIGIRGLLKYS